MTGHLATRWPGRCFADGPVQITECQRMFAPVHAPQRDPEPGVKVMAHPSLWVNCLFPTLPGELRAEEVERRPGGLEAWPPLPRALLAAARAVRTVQCPGASRVPTVVGDMGSASLLGRCWLGHPPPSPPRGFLTHPPRPPECLFGGFSVPCF